MSEHPWKRNYPGDGREFTKLEINIPREMRTWLDEMSGLLKLPPWRLICIALDNERDLPQPFQYPMVTPQTVFVEHAYRDEAVKIYRFLQKFRMGLGRDVLMLFRRQIGIPNKTTFLLAIRELLAIKMGIETDDFKKRNYMEYPPGYTIIRAASTPTETPRRIEAEKNRLEKLEAKLKRQRKKVELMEGNYERPVGKKTSDSEEAPE